MLEAEYLESGSGSFDADTLSALNAISKRLIIAMSWARLQVREFGDLILNGKG